MISLTLIGTMSDSHLREIAVFIVAKLSTDADRIVGVRLEIVDLMYSVRFNLITNITGKTTQHWILRITFAVETATRLQSRLGG